MIHAQLISPRRMTSLRHASQNIGENLRKLRLNNRKQPNPLISVQLQGLSQLVQIGAKLLNQADCQHLLSIAWPFTRLV